MKKLFAIIFALSVFSACTLAYSQKPDWKTFPQLPKNTHVSGFYNPDPESPGVFLATQTGWEGALPLIEPIIRNYDKNFESSVDMKCSFEIPALIDVHSFMGNIIVTGLTKKGQKKSMSTSAVVHILDQTGEMLTSHQFTLLSRNSEVSSLPKVTISSDSNYMIVSCVETCPKTQNRTWQHNLHVLVFNRKMDLEWEGVIDLGKCTDMDFITKIGPVYYKDNLYLFVSGGTGSDQNSKYELKILSMSDEDNFRVVGSKDFDAYNPSFETYTTKDNKIIVSGVAEHYAEFTSNKKTLFYFTVDLISDELVFAPAVAADRLPGANPGFNKKCVDELTSPQKILFLDDAIFWISESYSSNLELMAISPLTLIKFNLSGNLIWAKKIRNNINIKNYGYSSKSKAEIIDGQLHIFYLDFKVNLEESNLEKDQSIANDMASHLCLVDAAIMPNGAIERKTISCTKDSDVRVDMYYSTLCNNGSFLFYGLEPGRLPQKSYYYFYIPD